jgi:hypothetical protein
MPGGFGEFDIYQVIQQKSEDGIGEPLNPKERKSIPFNLDPISYISDINTLYYSITAETLWTRRTGYTHRR